MRTSPSRLVGLCCIALASGCLAEAPPAGPSVAITVAPLELPGITDASWRLTVSTAAGPVWTREVSSRSYGDGAGSLSYVGPCDADAGANTVTVELLALYEGAAGTTLVPASEYHNPGALSRTVTCLANADVAVTFDVTLARAATQGFFDVAVSFDDIFCSAKLDCEKPDGSDILLLADASGARRPTVVLGFACTADTAADDTVLYLDPLALSCNAGANTATVDPSQGPGNLAVGAGITQSAATLFGAAVYRGAEDLGGVGKIYWNLALGLNLGTAPAQSCTLTTTGTASSGPLAGGATPAGSTYPFIAWTVPLTSAAGALTCTQHPVGGNNGVAIAYAAPAAPETFAYSFANAASLPTGTGLVGARTVADPGRWADGQLAANCDGYRHPNNSSYAYTGSTGDGVYRVNPDGGGAYLVWCDMTTEDGGWTLVMRFTDANAYAADAAAWYTGSPAVASNVALTPTATGTSLAYGNLDGDELLIKTHAEAAGRWARFDRPAIGTMLELVGTTNISAVTDGFAATLTYVARGAAAHACFGQDWRVRWRNYGSSDGRGDSSVFAPSTLTPSVRPCGGRTDYATGIGVRTDTSDGWSGYGGSWEGTTGEPEGNAALTGGSVSLWVRGAPIATVPVATGVVGGKTEADPGRWADGTVAASCYGYRYPTDGHSYVGSTGDGVYRVNPDGLGDILVYCDMTLEGGGWTLVMRYTDVDAYAADAAVWYTGAPAVGATSAVTPSSVGVSAAYVTLVGDEMLFKTHGDAAGYWARFTLPSAQSLRSLVGTTNVSDGTIALGSYKDTIAFVAKGANAHACWGQSWRVRWRDYWSADNYPDSSVFAPSGAASGRPCGGNSAYATGIGVRTDTNNGFSGYGGSWEGVGSDGAGNPALAGSSVSLWVGGP